MLDDDNTTSETPDGQASGAQASGADGADAAEGTAPAKKPVKKAAAKKSTAKKAAVKTTTTRRTTKKAVAADPTDDTSGTPAGDGATSSAEAPATDAPSAEAPPAKKAAAKKTAAKKTTAKKTTAKKTTKKAAAKKTADAAPADAEAAPAEAAPTEAAQAEAPAVLFQAPEPEKPAKKAAKKTTAKKKAAPKAAEQADAQRGQDAGTTDADKADKDETGKDEDAQGGKSQSGQGKKESDKSDKDQDGKKQSDKDKDGADQSDQKQSDHKQSDQKQADQDQSGDDSGSDDSSSDDSGSEGGSGGGNRRRRRRGGRRRRKSGGGGDASGDSSSDQSDEDQDGGGDSDGSGDDNQGGEGGGSRRRRRRRRAGEDSGDTNDDPANTVTRVRKARSVEDEITAVTGSTRLEAKKQRRREGREAGRRRAPIVSEAEFLARRESVDRTMVIRQKPDLTQIAVLEDKVLVEHYVARESQTSLIGNVYLGRVQNVLPSMEAAFIDIGKGRNAVLYAGEVNWSALGHKDGQPRKIESVLSSGQTVLVQVTKDPIGHKGARLTSQVSLAGRFLVYVPDGTTSGISRKLPDTERARLKSLLKEIVPDSAGVIVRTAAEGAAEDELTRDVERLKARWEDIEAKAKSGGAPKLLYGEPDLTLKVVRDLFTEDFSKLLIEGDDAWETVQGYVSHVAPDLEERLEKYDAAEHDGRDSFVTHRIDEQIAKGLDRKVWLPSGGSLIIDRTEAMTVVDVNTGKFTGSGGNLEETVTKNNLEAAEEMVRQLRLRDIGGIIVIDFIDMVLESNRDLVLRRLVECLGRDRTRHQVAEVTSLGLVQMTRKRIGTGLVESFSENCTHCQGRGVVIHDAPVEPKKVEDEGRRGGRRGRGRGKGGDGNNGGSGGNGGGGNGGNGGSRSAVPSPKDVAAVAKPENADKPPLDEQEPAKQDTATQDASTTNTSSQDSSSQDAGSQDASNKDAGSKGAGSRSTSRSRQQSKKDQPAEEKPQAEGKQAEAKPTDATPSTTDTPTDSSSSTSSTEPTAPTVVTSTRPRRSASRRTGVVTPAKSEPVALPPTEPATPVAAAAPAAPPKVVTRTRGRKPATEQAATGETAAAPDVPAEAPPAPPEAPTEAPAAADQAPQAELHVPIKKKGSRKR